MIAGFSLIQTRVDKDKACIVSDKFNNWNAARNCWPALTPETKSVQPFGPKHYPNQYKSDEAGRFRQAFPLDNDLAVSMVKELKDNLWLDKMTREITVEFTVYNSAAQLFSVARIAFTQSETGTVDETHLT